MKHWIVLGLCIGFVAGCATQQHSDRFVYDRYGWRVDSAPIAPGMEIKEAAGAEQQKWEVMPRDIHQRPYTAPFGEEPRRQTPPQLNYGEGLYSPEYFL